VFAQEFMHDRATVCSARTMPEPIIETADLRVHREALVDLNVEYLRWVAAGIEHAFGQRSEDLMGMPIPDYVRSVIDKVCGEQPPNGRFYVARLGDRIVAMGGLRRLSTDVAEVKRLYVQPAVRGQRLGELLLSRLLADARDFGYAAARLDTAPFMAAAHRLYARHGFVDRGPYQGCEVPAALHAGWRFMECRW
jgi:GNAT superfamily N-acetyltransferase